jgi:Tol biopolymer transport system component
MSSYLWDTTLGISILLLVACVSVAALFLYNSRKAAELPLPQVEVLPLVVMPGGQAAPVFSPDGNQVAFEAFEWDGGSEIYTTLIDGAKPLRLARGESPTWSPDGRQIAFYDNSDPSGSINVVSALGGPQHRLYTYKNSVRPSLSWSPDGKTLAFSESDGASGWTGWIMLLSLTDSATRRLSSPPHHAVDSLAAFSPDGSALAFVRASGSGIGFVSDLFVVPLTGGEPKRLTFDNCPISGISWTPDGREIVFSSYRRGLSSLWRISASGGAPRPLAGIGVNALHPSISPKGNQLAYTQFAFNESIWRVDSKDDTHRHEPPVHVISGKPTARLPHSSPDGKRVAFDSDRSGYSEIWACDSDGSNCAQVTSLHARATNARWSPDSRYIAFEFHPKEHSEIGVVEVAGGLPRLVPTFPGADNAGPSWSRDGLWIYFHSNRGGGAFQVWKVPVGGGSPVQVTKGTGLYGVESADGRSIYYLNRAILLIVAWFWLGKTRISLVLV